MAPGMLRKALRQAGSYQMRVQFVDIEHETHSARLEAEGHEGGNGVDRSHDRVWQRHDSIGVSAAHREIRELCKAEA